MAWVSLFIAGLFEMFGVVTINMVNRNRDWKSLALMVLGFGGSFLFLVFAMKTLPMGTAYAIWTGIGAAGGSILGMVLYNEPRDWKRMMFILMIVGSAVGLKIIS
ncbi:DMT family transporter [Heyndrickxia acidiproducens]|uniref:DMT family transporter n=1 Tax=Heyndrickxia acidiproducens TaxID=1121084 RepID=UPI00037FF6C7|nr:multidrug efflux SMR transporter [Heyndrickxia acidiproducens]